MNEEKNKVDEMLKKTTSNDEELKVFDDIFDDKDKKEEVVEGK